MSGEDDGNPGLAGVAEPHNSPDAKIVRPMRRRISQLRCEVPRSGAAGVSPARRCPSMRARICMISLPLCGNVLGVCWFVSWVCCLYTSAFQETKGKLSKKSSGIFFESMLR